MIHNVKTRNPLHSCTVFIFNHITFIYFLFLLLRTPISVVYLILNFNNIYLPQLITISMAILEDL